EHERALIPALPSAPRVEDGAVEDNSAWARGERDRLGPGRVGIVAEQSLRHLREHARRAPLRDQPVRNRQVLRAEEGRVEQLGGVAGAGIAEQRYDRMVRPKVAGEADRAGDID